MSVLNIKYCTGRLKNLLRNLPSQKFHRKRKFHEISNKLVFVSLSNNVFENLALEDWFYKNLELDNQSALFLWVNKPCVVIGRHQNPWLETNLVKLSQQETLLARRNSGGGTVYHDNGNLNCTFLSSRGNYNRKSNLEFICKTLRETWNLNVSINKREDILFNDHHKVSGTASKLGYKNAYHHCTLLIDVDSTKLEEVLSIPKLNIQTKSTSSVRSQILNLKASCPEITINKVKQVLGYRYLENHSSSNMDFQLVSPVEDNFPGIGEIQETLRSWEWIYGKTPLFTLSWSTDDQTSQVHIDVNRGIIEKFILSKTDTNSSPFRRLADLLINKKIDKKLHDVLLNHSTIYNGLNDDDCSKLTRVLLKLCSTTV